jgi:Domain of unknown function (DUF4168)
MPNCLYLASRTGISHLLVKSLIVGLCSTFSIVSGAAPRLTSSGATVSFDTFAYAQNFTSEEVTSYAKAVLAIEGVRQTALDEIKRNRDRDTGEMPSIACNQPSGLDRLPRGARRIFVEYCQQSKSIVEKHGLSASRFNEITINERTNPDLQRRIRSEIIRLQDEP